MASRIPYWQGPTPSGVKRWQGATQATIVDLDVYGEDLLRMYRRYVKEWNEIELDNSRQLAEHTHHVGAARVVGSSGRFILTSAIDRETGWILEIEFGRGFKQYFPGLSCGLNSPRSAKDLKRVTLHWRGAGEAAFGEWLKNRSDKNSDDSESFIYRA